ncbi:hypothetical protein DICPUDRAFT_30555 [Dictyostelium purpureum]|uniref:Malonyl-CoA decarboxylase C-terminal domain-containing protein n=1 Tax=Dictyostelium purpureum TaxID=5786 RepID=F0ZFP5_DICPU|nr:uncharacterized protein DICPUDRAFT_30555 [Dictyostelium purpureum]EGC37245.1 hypothetical protein DICPUDRAFT_30555 [Dictyostelium purpureum]|eukprot:XP_003286215.1 hypothetical protein DICPUDRAFT_30555 [Dictyostelium purpureum]
MYFPKKNILKYSGNINVIKFLNNININYTNINHNNNNNHNNSYYNKNLYMTTINNYNNLNVNRNKYFCTKINNNNNYNNGFFKNYNINSKNLKLNERKELIESFIVDLEGGLIRDKVYRDIGIVGNSNKQEVSSDILESLIKIRDDLERYILENSKTTSTTKSSVLNSGIIELDMVLGDLIKDNLKNNGILYCKPLDTNSMEENVWRSIIENEAVHPYHNLSDPTNEIKNRTTRNRTCLVLFHPRLPNLPLMSLYIAFTNGIPDNIPAIELNDPNAKENDINNIDSAIFYSISSLHKGLGGVNLGHILITKAVEYIKLNNPKILHFCTLSPLPRFKKYLSKNHQKIVEKIQNEDLINDFKNDLEYLALNYIYKEKSKPKRAYDPVCNFHLKNGASIYRLNWKADTSKKRLDESYGIMINYYYDINNLQENSTRYTNDGFITTCPIFNIQFKNSKF